MIGHLTPARAAVAIAALAVSAFTAATQVGSSVLFVAAILFGAAALAIAMPNAQPPDPLHEWRCPACGATTRARMADHPEKILAAIDGPIERAAGHVAAGEPLPPDDVATLLAVINAAAAYERRHHRRIGDLLDTAPTEEGPAPT